MKKKLETRLEKLKEEFQSGQTMLEELDSKRDHLRETLIRISGAIQVLQEELDIQQTEKEPAINT